MPAVRRLRPTALLLVATTLVLVVLTPAGAGAQRPPDGSVIAGEIETPRFQTPGLAVLVEVGRYDGGQGLVLAYYHPLPIARLTVGAEVGAGYTGGDDVGSAGRLHGLVAYGYRHRALLTVGYAVVQRDRLLLHGIPAADRSFWGSDVAAGYELMGGSGASVRLLAGATYARRAGRSAADRLQPIIVLSVGWKFL